MKKKIFWSLLLLVAMLLSGCARTTEIRFGTADIGGTYYAYGSALAQLTGSEDVRFDIKNTAGSAANLRLLSEEYLQMAIAQSDMIDDAWNGRGVFEGQARKGYRAVASLYTEPCQIVVRADSDIRTVEDLRGKAVSVGEEESGVRLNAEQILLCCGLSFEMLQVRDLSYSAAAQALKNGEIDAFFCTAGVPTNAVSALAREVPVRLLELNKGQMERLVETYGGYIECTVPAGTYQGQTEPVTAAGVRAVLLASDKMSADAVKAVAAGMFAQAEQLRFAVAADTSLTLETSGEGVTIPYHAGAAEFYRENGITVETEG